MTGYRVFLGRKTPGAPFWSVETAEGVQEAHVVVFHGTARTGWLPDHHYPSAIVGTGRLTTTVVDGQITIDLWDSGA